MDRDDIFNLGQYAKITNNIIDIIHQRNELAAKIAQLEAAGCIWGNIVEEWRGENGPYYRLTFYVDKLTGHKPAPRYIKRDKLETVQQQINNHAKCVELREQLKQVDVVLLTIKSRTSNLLHYTKLHAGTMEQLKLSEVSNG